MKKLQVMLGISAMMLVGGVAVFSSQQFKAPSRSELLAEAAVPPSSPTGQRNPPGYGGGSGNGSNNDGGTKGPSKYQPKLPRG